MEEYDGCQQSKGEPVLKLDFSGEILWPVIAIQKVVALLDIMLKSLYFL
jgi:hypothetical protein